MKKAISLLLALVLLLSVGVTGWADEEGITAEKVFRWLEEGDEASETTDEQAANGALRLAEMLVVLDSSYVETQDDADRLESYLSALAEVDVPGGSASSRIAIGLIETLNGLLFFEQALDRNGVYEDELMGLIDDYKAADETVQTAAGQAVNALYYSVYTASLILRGLAPNQQVLDQIDEEMAAFHEGDEAAADIAGQLVNGGETLFRLMTAMASVLAPDSDYAARIREVSESKYAESKMDDDTSYRLANWLYGCVAMTGLLVEEVMA